MSKRVSFGFSRSGQIVYGGTLVRWFTRPILFPAAFVEPEPLRGARLGSMNNIARLERALSYRFCAIVTGMLPRIIATISLASLCLLSYMLTFTSPADAGPLGLLVIFITAYLTFVGMISFFLFGIQRLFVLLSTNAGAHKAVRRVEFKRIYYYSTVLAAAPVMLIGLQSVQTIGLYEVVLVIVFEVVACLYINKRMR